MSSLSVTVVAPWGMSPARHDQRPCRGPRSKVMMQVDDGRRHGDRWCGSSGHGSRPFGTGVRRPQRLLRPSTELDVPRSMPMTAISSSLRSPRRTGRQPWSISVAVAETDHAVRSRAPKASAWAARRSPATWPPALAARCWWASQPGDGRRPTRRARLPPQAHHGPAGGCPAPRTGVHPRAAVRASLAEDQVGCRSNLGELRCSASLGGHNSWSALARSEGFEPPTF